MKTSDKELDKLFNTKLNSLEAEPSANLWQNIAAKLDEKPKKKSLIPVLRIAAGILVFISAGLFWMLPNKGLVKKQLPQKVAKVESKPAQKKEIVQAETNIQQKPMLLLQAKKGVVKEASAKQTVQFASLKPKEKPELKAAETVNQTISQNTPLSEQQLAALPQQQNKAVAPDESVPLKVQTTETDEDQPKQQTVLAAKSKPETIVVKRKGIRHVGDLVNFVMAKVDKRADKLIEFSDSDNGDESNVTGINLGIISIKKEK